MPDETGEECRTHRVRPARDADLAHLAAIEDAGGPQFAAYFGPAIHPVLLSPATDGRQRALEPGFVLVAADDEQSPPVGFVHVLVIDGHAHLEQVSVLPERQGQGIGAALVRAAMAQARAQGFDRLSLCTYREVPWNAPFYRGLGFTEVTELAAYQRRLREKERELGLEVNGERCVMEVALR
ncbi:MAG TPA: GNAT family N-acetyltransferase [Nocardioides sp.]|uniref:GNAT family N-acetyltransferase n=1 Tax=Nocardioides sp. TaxID=35761 RepID=UPI002E36C903|nr:GNAT family N-acetyltransferase [Nocardioides sp.]HEX5090719.1 GNAT family N-acetyltransferase [Nocardioides sp.]